MPRKRAKSADQKSLGTPGTTETAGALRKTASGLTGNPAVCYRPRRSRVHLGNVGLEEAGAVPPATGVETAQQAAPTEVARRVVALVEFSGLRDWQQIRSKLTQIAGVQELEIDSLQARRAAISFKFGGSLDRLQAALGQNGFMLEDRDGTLVLRSQ